LLRDAQFFDVACFLLKHLQPRQIFTTTYPITLIHTCTADQYRHVYASYSGLYSDIGTGNGLRRCNVVNAFVPVHAMLTLTGAWFGTAGARIGGDVCLFSDSNGVATAIHALGRETTEVQCLMAKHNIGDIRYARVIAPDSSSSEEISIQYDLVYTCSDGVRNGDEVEVDCGGSCGSDCLLTLASITSNPFLGRYGCTPDGAGGLQHCPHVCSGAFIGEGGDSGVSITLTGTAFTDDAAVSSNVCVPGTLTHTAGAERTQMTCLLSPSGQLSGDKSVSVSVSTVFGSKQSAAKAVNYGPLPTCDDGVQNGDETSVDTGGSCVGIDNGIVFAPPACDDRIRNGDETDVDCGGAYSKCPPCPTIDADAVTSPLDALPPPRLCRITANATPSTTGNVNAPSSAAGGACLDGLFGGLTYCPNVGGVRVTFVGDDFFPPPHATISAFADSADEHYHALPLAEPADTVFSNLCASAMQPLHLPSMFAPAATAAASDTDCGSQALTCILKAWSPPAAGGTPSMSTEEEIFMIAVGGSGSVARATVTNANGESGAVPVHYAPASTCCDGIANGDEWAIDCGGSCPVCAAYYWQEVTSFGACPSDCDSPSSTITREVECRSSIGNGVVADAFCDDVTSGAGPRNDTYECSATPACTVVSYVYVVESTFQLCPTQCGAAPSTVTRSVVCRGSDGTAVADGVCDAAGAVKPPAEASCAATQACVVFYWNKAFEMFNDCPSACGAGASTQTRRVPCVTQSVDATTQETITTIVDDALCSNAGARDDSRTCAATRACAVYYTIAATPFPACPDDCGLSVSQQTRAVFCVTDAVVGDPSSQVRVDDTLCADLPPAARDDTRACPSTTPCVFFAWTPVGPFADCPTECGLPDSVIQRDVICGGSDGSVVGDSVCVDAAGDTSDAERDALRFKTCTSPPCVSFEWRIQAAFPSCPSACGISQFSYVYRPLVCVRVDATDAAGAGVAVADAECAALAAGDGADAPVYVEQNGGTVERKTCEPTPACAIFTWDKSAPFQRCDAVCGAVDVVVSRRVPCIDSTGVQVPDVNCAGNGPKEDTLTCAACVDSAVVIRSNDDGDNLWDDLLWFLILFLLCLALMLCLCVGRFYRQWMATRPRTITTKEVITRTNEYELDFNALTAPHAQLTLMPPALRAPLALPAPAAAAASRYTVQSRSASMHSATMTQATASANVAEIERVATTKVAAVIADENDAAAANQNRLLHTLPPNAHTTYQSKRTVRVTVEDPPLIERPWQTQRVFEPLHRSIPDHYLVSGGDVDVSHAAASDQPRDCSMAGVAAANVVLHDSGDMQALLATVTQMRNERVRRDDDFQRHVAALNNGNGNGGVSAETDPLSRSFTAARVPRDTPSNARFASTMRP
jgi:hypothetical protein